jgi:integrase
MKKEKYISEKVGKHGTTLEIKIPYYNEWGERKYHSKSFNTSDYNTKAETMRAARTYRDMLVYQMNMGQVPNKKVTVAECYELTKKVYSFSMETRRKHDIRFNNLKKYHDMPITKVTAFDIQLSLNELADKSQDVINSVFTIWRQIYHVAILNDYIYQDPTLKVVAPRSQKISHPKSVEMTCELSEVLNAIRDYGGSEFNSNIIAYALITMAYLGLRPSEAYALCKDDIDFNRGIVRINKAIGSTTNDLVSVKTTKNINSVRILPLPNELVPYLQECIEYQPSDYLFATETGKFITSRKYANFIHNACVKANINFRPYMLRHAFSTKLVTSNTDIRTVQELMGHKNINMTVDYARSTDELKRNAINRISMS